jgi:hypothetical protein
MVSAAEMYNTERPTSQILAKPTEKKRRTVVPADERVPIPICYDAVHMFLRLLQRDVHVAIETR